MNNKSYEDSIKNALNGALNYMFRKPCAESNARFIKNDLVRSAKNVNRFNNPSPEESDVLPERLFGLICKGEFEVERHLLFDKSSTRGETDDVSVTTLRFEEGDLKIRVAINQGDIVSRDLTFNGEKLNVLMFSHALSQTISDWVYADVSYRSPVDNSPNPLTYAQWCSLMDLSGLDATPLHYAASFGHVELVEFLLRHDIDVNAIDTDGDTALHSAASQFQFGVGPGKAYRLSVDQFFGTEDFFQNVARTISLLCKAGADVSIKNKDGKTPIEMADFDSKNMNSDRYKPLLESAILSGHASNTRSRRADSSNDCGI